MPRSRLPPLKLLRSSGSACFCQVGGHVCRGHAVLDLCVSDGAVLLSEMQPQLTLVAEVQVAFFTLKKKAERRYFQPF